MELRDNKPAGGRRDVLSTTYTGREILSGRISGKRAEYSSDRTNAQAVAVDDEPGVEEESREERVTSLWGIQQGEAPKADAAQSELQYDRPGAHHPGVVGGDEEEGADRGLGRGYVVRRNYRTDLPAISKEMWGKCTFCGNVDPSGVLCMGTEWDIIEKTTRLLEAQKENPRFILNAGCALPQSPWKKICARL